MAYPDQCLEVGGFYCPWVPYFSNPDLTYNGDPMGVPADHPSTGVDGPADAVGTLDDRREITANFRRSSSSPTPRVGLTMSPYWLAEDGGVSTVTATLHRPSSANTTVTILASPSDAVTLSGSRTLTIPAGRTVSVDSVTITGVDNGDQTGDVSVSVSATAANTSSLGVIAPEPVELAIADDETTPVVTLSLSPSEIAEHEGWAFVTAMLDSRSSADTAVTVSATPAEVVEEIEENILTIPAGQSASIGEGVKINAVDDSELTEAEKLVTVSGTAGEQPRSHRTRECDADDQRRRSAVLPLRQHCIHLHGGTCWEPFPARSCVWQGATDVLSVSCSKQRRKFHPRPTRPDGDIGNLCGQPRDELHPNCHGRRRCQGHHDD